jgi:hypothetical protein
MLLKKLKIHSNGNISLPALAGVIIFSILFMVIFDICRIFIAREETKNASDAASLAVVQNLLFFEEQDCSRIAGEIIRSNNCKLIECICDYDAVTVTVEKDIRFILVNKFTGRCARVKSTSRAKVVYPWDERFDYCNSCEFSF